MSTRYFSPAKRVQELGRELPPKSHSKLLRELKQDEVLFGLYKNDGWMYVAPDLTEKAEFDEAEKDLGPLHKRIGFYAIPKQLARTMAPY